MLIQFVVENFLSFRDKAVLSMLAADTVEHVDTHCLRLPGLPPVLKCAALYGANASGKSNVVKAFHFARKLVVDGTKAGEPIPLRPFKLDPASLSAPTRFEFDIHAAGRRYSYGFILSADAVESEWLFVNAGGEDQPLFERDRGSEGPRPVITLGETLTQHAGRRQFLGFVAEGTRPNQLFLTEAADHGVDELGAVTEWFQDGLVVVRPGLSDFIPDLQRLEESAAFRHYLGELLKSAGTGISGVAFEKTGDASLNETVQRLFAAGLRGTPEDIGVKLHHLSSTGTLVPFVLGEESDGTRRLMALAPVLFDLVQPKNGAPVVHVIDELDRSLHPLLTRFFLDAFFRASSPENPGQILFTTHDTNLLDLNVLSRDSVWFTEKDGGGASNLYSLAEFKGEQLDRISEHLEVGYLQGRFGAIPFLGDARRLGWASRASG